MEASNRSMECKRNQPFWSNPAMYNKLVTKYNPYVRDVSDDLFLLDEDFDQFDSPIPAMPRQKENFLN
jgi:hypothetical protein